MVNQLPIVVIDGRKYFKDERLLEYRRINNPHERISFEEAATKNVMGYKEGKKKSRGKRL